MRRLGELHMREQHLNLGFRQLKEDTSMLLDRLTSVLSVLPLGNYSADHELQLILKLTSSHLRSYDALKPPNVYHFLPHLLFNDSSLRPHYQSSKNRTGGTNLSILTGIAEFLQPCSQGQGLGNIPRPKSSNF